MKILKLTYLIALAFLGTSALEAAQTNLVQTLNVDLASFSQGPVVTNGNIINSTLYTSRISNRDIIQALGTATTNSFSPHAALLVIKPLPDGDLNVVIRDGTNSLEVTRFFAHDRADTTAVRGRVNTVTGIASGSEYSLHSLSLKDAVGAPPLTIHFEVSGLTRATFVSLLNDSGKSLGTAYEYSAVMSGTGDVNGKDSLFEGGISGKGRKIEIVP